MQETQVLVQKSLDKELEGAKKISDAHKKKLDEINKEELAYIKAAKAKEKADMAVLNAALQNAKKKGENTARHEDEIRERYKKTEEDITRYVQDNNDKRAIIIRESTQATTAEIDSNYEKQKNSLLAKYELEAQAIRNATNLTIASEDEKTAHVQYAAADREAAEIAQYNKLLELETRKGEDLKKLEQQIQKDKNAIFGNFMKQRSEKMEVYVDEDTKRIKKSTKKTAGELDAFFQDLISKDKSLSDKTIEQIVDFSTKSQKANADAAKEAKKTADANKQAADATKKTAEATNEAADATKKYLDIEATRNKLLPQINEFKATQKVIQDKLLAQVDAFNDEIEAAGDNAEKRKEIEEKKKAFINQTGAELIAIQQDLNAAEKKEQDLSMIQWKQYAQKGEEIANQVKGFTGKVGDYFSTAFTSMSSLYKAEIAAIDEEMKQFAAKKAEAEGIVNNSVKYLSNLKEEQAQAQKNGDQELVNSLQERINKEGDILADAQNTQRTYAIKQEELQREKNKKAAEQEKIEKLNRKATLIKNIGEATANVAQGVAKTIGAYPWPFNLALATLVGAAGAVQIGIMTKQLAKFEDGGLLNGKRHSQGGMRIQGTNIEVEGGEYVVNRESTNKNLGLVQYINSQRKELTPTDINGFFAKTSQGYEPPFRSQFETGGQLPVIENPNSIDNDVLVAAIKSIKIEPKVAVTDILRVQDEMTHIDGWSGI